MLAAASRLRRRAEFRLAASHGARAKRPTLVLHLYRPAAESSQPARVGFAVGRQLGPAVLRNRVRRRLRHLMRERLVRVPSGSLVIVRGLAPASSASYQQLGRDLDRALDRLLGAAAR